MTGGFSPAGAERAAGRGELAAWVDAFLRGPGGNLPFADGLRRAARVWTQVPEQPLDMLRRVCGPEEGMPFFTPQDAFEARIGRMLQALAAGWTPPPLIVHAPDLTVSDGNHRLESLRRARYTTYPALLWSTVSPG